MIDSSVLVHVQLGGSQARCPHCRSTEFAQADPGHDLTYNSDLLCAVCETPTTQAELVLQVADEALAKARRRLACSPE